MIAHIVLLQPRPDLTDEQRDAALALIRRTAGAVPEIRRFQLGRRIMTGLAGGYEQLMTLSFEFALIVEFDDVEALKRYLAAPAHEEFGALFYTATTAALAYDYAIEEIRA